MFLCLVLNKKCTFARYKWVFIYNGIKGSYSRMYYIRLQGDTLREETYELVEGLSAFAYFFCFLITIL